MVKFLMTQLNFLPRRVPPHALGWAWGFNNKEDRQVPVLMELTVGGPASEPAGSPRSWVGLDRPPVLLQPSVTSLWVRTIQIVASGAGLSLVWAGVSWLNAPIPMRRY